MVERFTSLLYRFPNMAHEIGRAMYSIAAFGLLAGGYVQIGRIATSIAKGIAGQPLVTDAARLWPGLWTWWIPESVSGVALFLLLAGAGIWVAVTAKEVKRLLRAV
jgi:hypothetical protein